MESYSFHFYGWLDFDFFKFERNPKPYFVRGCFSGDLVHLRHCLKVSDYSSMLAALPLILQLCCACETIFDIMLSTYLAGLKVYYVQSEEQGRKQGSKRPRLDGWDWARQLADRALAAFREAEVQRENGDLDSLDATVGQALLGLQKRYKCYPHLQPDQPFLIPHYRSSANVLRI
jgi:hypothetical protein